MAGTAMNLKLRVLNYFRLDLMSGRALAISHRISNVSWRVTQGTLGAKLQLALLPKESQPERTWRRADRAPPARLGRVGFVVASHQLELATAEQAALGVDLVDRHLHAARDCLAGERRLTRRAR